MCIIFYHNQSAKATFKDGLDGHAGLTGGQWDIVVLLGRGDVWWRFSWFMLGKAMVYGGE